MADEPDNIVIELLREMRGDMQEVKARLDRMEVKLDDNTQAINGLNYMFLMPAGQMHTMDDRIEKLEEKIGA